MTMSHNELLEILHDGLIEATPLKFTGLDAEGHVIDFRYLPKMEAETISA